MQVLVLYCQFWLFMFDNSVLTLILIGAVLFKLSVFGYLTVFSTDWSTLTGILLKTVRHLSTCCWKRNLGLLSNVLNKILNLEVLQFKVFNTQ